MAAGCSSAFRQPQTIKTMTHTQTKKKRKNKKPDRLEPLGVQYRYKYYNAAFLKILYSNVQSWEVGMMYSQPGKKELHQLE